MSTSNDTHILLLAHGSREPGWAEPFASVRARMRHDHPTWTIHVAYLESMAPSLPDALDAAATDGCVLLHLIPLFLGAGGHLKRDIPRAVREAGQRHPGMRIVVAPAAGESPELIEALAAYAARSAGHTAD